MSNTPLEDPQEAVDEEGARRLLCAVLWQSARDLAFGTPRISAYAREWMHGQQAAHYASLVGLGSVWPPTRRQIVANVTSYRKIIGA